MKINIQIRNFQDNNDLIKTYIDKKLSKLSNYYDKIISADVYLKVENTSSKENKSVEIRLAVPGEDLVVGKSGQNFEECIDLSVDILKKLIIRKKEKLL